MERAIELLRLVANSCRGVVAPGVIPDRLIRFSLEFSAPPDTAQVRAVLTLLIGEGAWTLDRLAPDGPLSRFLLLQFPGLERTISAKSLFGMGDALVEPLGLVSCTPDIGANFYAEPDAAIFAAPRREEVLLDLFCWSDAAAPADTRWALAAIRATEAWTLSRGDGVVIAQPDTGVAAHPELEPGALLLEQARNIIEGGSDPTDPLDASETNPGHGTATASVAISRESGEVTGSAPAAKLVPIRCINDVKILDSTPVAAAVDHAIRIKADIITMSLGGPITPALNAAAEAAVEAGLIVLAAAGNCTGPIVVYPARDRRVIGVAGVDSQDKPWKGTAYGPSVTISAPAENVFVARRTPTDGGVPAVSGGQGTSFAVALTAGAAALWLAHHGRQAVRDEAARRGIVVQDLFRDALVTTARRPAGWIAHRYGAGIVDAHALLRLSLANIPRLPQPEAAFAVADVDEVMDRAELRLPENGFDWARYGAMAAYFAWDAARRNDVLHAKTAEAVPRQTPPAALPMDTMPPALRRALNLPPLVAIRPTPSAAPQHARYLEILGGPGGLTPPQPGQTATVSLESARQSLANGGSDDLLRLLEQAFAEEDRAEAGRDPAASALRRATLAAAPEALGRVSVGTPEPLAPNHRLALEALVELTGRTAIRVRNNTFDFQGQANESWGMLLLGMRDFIEQTLPKVGRIDVDGQHAGTGTVVGDGLVLTNRHVLEAMADGVRAADGSIRWFLNAKSTINFDSEALDSAKQFTITQVVAAGADPTFGRVDFAHLDLALLAVETSNSDGKPLPGAVPFLANKAFASQRSDLFLIGYPARPNPRDLVDPVTKDASAGVDALVKMFGADYSVKYLSPGRIKIVLGSLTGDAAQWIFSHDATTLGGNSGSLVYRFGDPAGAFGLHFSGEYRVANYAHAMGAVRASHLIPPLEGLTWT